MFDIFLRWPLRKRTLPTNLRHVLHLPILHDTLRRYRFLQNWSPSISIILHQQILCLFLDLPCLACQLPDLCFDTLILLSFELELVGQLLDGPTVVHLPLPYLRFQFLYTLHQHLKLRLTTQILRFPNSILWYINSFLM